MSSSAPLRNDNWLLSRLDYLWSTHFLEIEQSNPTHIHFGRYSKYRLGSIKLNRQTGHSFITITGMFKSKSIPQEVVDHTIGHELTHYAHGFSSKRVRLHRYPHAGGVVRKEMAARGMGHLYIAYKDWIRKYRQTLRKIHGW